MADIQIPEKKRRKTVQSPRIDLTPMVDLGFILITFFIYTTTLSESKALVLNRPIIENTNQVKTVYIDTSTVTIIPTANNKYAYYYGILDHEDEIRMTDYNQLRNIIAQKQSELKHLPESYSQQARQLHVIIKPADNSTYRDVVNVLDEMLINQVTYYALTDITDEENNMLELRHDN